MVGATILLAVMSVHTATVPRNDDDIDLDKLLELYKSYGLLLPPKDAIPVVFETRSRGNGLPSGKSAHIVVFKYTIGDGKSRFMYGPVDDWKPQKNKQTEISPDDPDVLPLLRSVFRYDDERGARLVGDDFMLATAIQAHYLGEKDLAQFLVKNEEGSAFLGPGWHAPPLDASAELRVTYIALHDAINDWFDVEQDRNEIAGRILRIVADEGKIDTPYSAVNGFRDDFIEDLRQTIAPREEPDDPVERLIEELLTEGGHLVLSQDPENTGARKRIEELGVRALPALKRHIEDRRLTRYTRSLINNDSGEPMRLSSIISSLIWHITNRDVSVRPEPGFERLVDAWIKAKEEDDRRIFFRVAMEFHDYSARKTLQKEYVSKFPQDFKATYNRLVGQGLHPTFAMADVVMDGDFTDEEKVNMLRLFGEKGPMGGARYAMRFLPSVSHEHTRSVFVSWFDQAFDGLPYDQKRWDAGDVAHFMDQYADEILWERFAKKYKEADARTQVEVLMGIATLRRFGIGGQKQAIEIFIEGINNDSPAPNQDKRKNWHNWFGGPFEGQTMGDVVTVMLFKSLVDATSRDPDVPDDAKGVAALRPRLLAKLKELGYKVDGG